MKRHFLLGIALTSLMEAADRVDSTTGVQMAYLKRWARRSHNRLTLRMPELVDGEGEALRREAEDAAEAECDVAYLDPPYNQHSYLGNYHVWETLVRWDALDLVPKAGGTLLDLGGGIGATAAAARLNGHADRAGVADLVAEHTRAAPVDFRMAGDLEDPAFLDDVIRAEGPFATILCLDVLEHLRDPWSVVAALHRALVPGGTIVASIPNVRHYRAVFPLVFRNRWTLTDAGILDRTHLRFFVRDTAVGLMTSSGLVLDHVAGKPSGGRAARVVRALGCGLLDSFTDLQFLIRVRRDAAGAGAHRPGPPARRAA